MFKVTNLPKETMDVVMQVARATNNKPEEVIVNMLNSVSLKEAMTANDKQRKLQP